MAQARADGEDYITTHWDGHYMLPAFLDCVRWALTQDWIADRFKAKTGSDVTGTLESLQAFSDLVAEDVFGLPKDLEVGDG